MLPEWGRKENGSADQTLCGLGAIYQPSTWWSSHVITAHKYMIDQSCHKLSLCLIYSEFSYLCIWMTNTKHREGEKNLSSINWNMIRYIPHEVYCPLAKESIFDWTKGLIIITNGISTLSSLWILQLKFSVQAITYLLKKKKNWPPFEAWIKEDKITHLKPFQFYEKIKRSAMFWLESSDDL